jgi:hypothetical protein
VDLKMLPSESDEVLAKDSLSENHRSSRQRKLGPHVSRLVRTRRPRSAELDF